MAAPTLTEAQRVEIKERYAAGGISQAALAVDFGVHQTCVSKVLRDERRMTERAALLHEAQQLRAEGKKRCGRCRTAKARDEFYANRASHDGLGQTCRECDLVTQRERHAVNPEKKRSQASRWAKDHPDEVRRKSRIAASARRARIRDAFVEDVDPQIVFERDEGICGICGDPVDREEFDVDHVVPLAHGGEHSYANVRLSHVSCNRRRGRSVALALINVG